jgi:hypothetical protein
VTRVPLLAGTRVVVVDAGEDGVVLRPPPPAEAIADVGAAVRDALRFPLEGEPLEALVGRGSRATVVIEPPSLPLPSAQRDPRQAAIASTVEELERLGIPTGYQTLLVAGGLARRLSHRDLGALVEPDFARRFHGHVAVHDVEDDDLVPVAEGARGAALRVNRAMIDTDVVVVVSAAESTIHGGPGLLVGAADRDTARAAGALSLLETSASAGWRLGVALERALRRRVPLVGVSLTLNHVRPGGAARGYPFEPEAVERVARSPLRSLFRLVPGAVRARVLRSLPVELTAAAVFAGPPSVAHAEALLRGVELRAADLDGQLDAICIGVPRTTPYLPRERPNPLLAAYLGLALALRLWRDAFQVVDGGTAILLHRFHRAYAHPTQHPYREFFAAVRAGRSEEAVAEGERAAAGDPRAVESYRAGRTCHPVLPYADWAACAPAIERLGAVLVAGCRDATAARLLGFVPTHGLGAALAMARARTERPPRIGFLLSPPYFPLRVATAGAA